MNESTSTGNAASRTRPAGWAVGLVRYLPRLPSRISELELAVTELRHLERRMAELTDLVAEVLLPAAARVDDDELRRRLQAYTSTL